MSQIGGSTFGTRQHIEKDVAMSNNPEFYPGFVYSDLKQAMDWLEKAFGFRSLSGPFEQFGQEAFTALGWAFVAVCTLDVLAGIWLWQRKRRGAKLGLATTPFAFTLAIGFALPFLLLVVPVRIGLVLADWRSLR